MWQTGFAANVGVVMTHLIPHQLGGRGKAPAAPVRPGMTSAQEINDDIVQNLIVAQMALERGDDERSSAAIRCALEAARALIEEMAEHGRGGSWQRPGAARVPGA